MKYVVLSSAAYMPHSCWGKYKRVAVVETDGIRVPKMISTHARGTVRIVETWEKLNVGTTDRCAYQRALRDAQSLADKLNAD